MINVKYFNIIIIYEILSNYFRKIFIHNYSSINIIPTNFLDVKNFDKFEYIIKFRFD